MIGALPFAPKPRKMRKRYAVDVSTLFLGGSLVSSSILKRTELHRWRWFAAYTRLCILCCPAPLGPLYGVMDAGEVYEVWV